MKTLLSGICLFAYVPVASAQDVFGSGEHQFTMDFVDVGNPGNAADTDPYLSGAVDYEFRMGTYEVSQQMIDAYNALSGKPAIFMWPDRGPNKPATFVSWNSAAQFVNWLNTSKGYSPAYKFTADEPDSATDIELWTSADAGYDPANPYRNANAHYVLPSMSEWHKAAFYDPSANGGAGGYWDYATGSNSAPVSVSSGTSSGTAVYNHSSSHGPAEVDNAGGLSPYGTMAQNGNVWEWIEDNSSYGSRDPSATRLYRGGDWFADDWEVDSSYSTSNLPGGASSDTGFRVAAVPVATIPEPSYFFLIGVAGLIAFTRRRRRDRTD